MKAREIENKLDINNRMKRLAKIQAFIALKDHKENFRNNSTCRLINPTKGELDKISKIILKEINTQVKETLIISQWKNTRSAIDWFRNKNLKQNCLFIQLDIKDFYSSIRETKLDKALTLDKEYIKITL